MTGGYLNTPFWNIDNQSAQSFAYNPNLFQAPCTFIWQYPKTVPFETDLSLFGLMGIPVLYIW